MATLLKANGDKLNIQPKNGQTFEIKELINWFKCGDNYISLDYVVIGNQYLVVSGNPCGKGMNAEATKLLQTYYEGDAMLVSSQEYPKT